MSMDVKVAVAAHKPYWMPSDPMYLPVQVGAAGKPLIAGYERDDSGDSISSDNRRYCELTGLYWAWRNLGADYIGLSHYRRQFAGSGDRGTLTSAEAAAYLRRAPLVLPRLRRYYIETVEGHYAHTFDGSQLDILRDVLSERCPEYLPAFDAHMRERSAHICNMIIARRDVLDGYLSWLFPVLREAERRIDFSGMTPFEARCMGRLSERLQDVWVSREGLSYVECPIVSMEPVDWRRKVGSFLAAKFFGRKYEGSF